MRWLSQKSASKRLAAINKLVREVIPRDPGRADFRQGLTLGPEHRHWRRAKFFQQYRLFFRFHQDRRVIVLAWVNDETTKRAYGTKSHACRVFQGMLRRGHPPNDRDTPLLPRQRVFETRWPWDHLSPLERVPWPLLQGDLNPQLGLDSLLTTGNTAAPWATPGLAHR
ncbi:MAG: type II toxin-antitoxin system YhaV family toxin [Synechococcus sp. SB0667_bin_8]|nr:type II toxin-antitoxin system YhaV family toxin [Synechococcus sp. SB0667_bin_8]MYG64736.1 type II toxin-antitoxin system YhaV family toxin [Synechococcus sp. SB0675_bin_7]MYK85162.1 type II toxin-antitoxin system YhaV family toxin [Synechococcus sp. SB0669_bin_7]